MILYFNNMQPINQNEMRNSGLSFAPLANDVHQAEVVCAQTSESRSSDRAILVVTGVLIFMRV